MNTLDEICARKRNHIAARRASVPLSDLLARIKDAPPARDFAAALREHPGPAIIAEVKKASPSRGIIRADFDPVAIAGIYEECGAACISVLTDEPYFQGRDEYLVEIRSQVTLPVLRKDFMLDEYQIYESRALGADCILLIMAALDDITARKLHDLARSLGMAVLAEVHDAQELKRALALSPAMIGVNNRDLKTLNVDLRTSHRLAGEIPAGTLKIAESGIGDFKAIQDLQSAGYAAFLVGESLMRETDIAAAFKNLTRVS